MTVDQASFAAAVLAPGVEAPVGLSDPNGGPAGRRFDVYRNNVVAGLTSALETAFPVVRKLLGDANFRTMAGVFVRRHPPRRPLMMFYGAELPIFLETFPPTRTLGYLPDVARLEQALRESYHARDAAPIDASSLRALAPDRLMETKLVLAHALRVVRSRWPILSIWRYNTSAASPRPVAESQDVAVVRPAYDPEPLPLPPGGADFLMALTRGDTLGDAVDAAETPGFDLAALLTLLLSAGAIIGPETET
jgi:hypothetical protein